MLEPSADEIRDWGNSVTQFMIDYLGGLRDRPAYRHTSSREIRSGLDSKVPIKGIDTNPCFIADPRTVIASGPIEYTPEAGIICRVPPVPTIVSPCTTTKPATRSPSRCTMISLIFPRRLFFSGARVGDFHGFLFLSAMGFVPLHHHVIFVGHL